MGVILLPERDGGEHVSAVELCERVLEVAPEATCRLVKDNVQGVCVEVDDSAAVQYLMTMYTATGRERKG